MNRAIGFSLRADRTTDGQTQGCWVAFRPDGAGRTAARTRASQETEYHALIIGSPARRIASGGLSRLGGIRPASRRHQSTRPSLVNASAASTSLFQKFLCFFQRRQSSATHQAWRQHPANSWCQNFELDYRYLLPMIHQGGFVRTQPASPLLSTSPATRLALPAFH